MISAQQIGGKMGTLTALNVPHDSDLGPCSKLVILKCSRTKLHDLTNVGSGDTLNGCWVLPLGRIGHFLMLWNC